MKIVEEYTGKQSEKIEIKNANYIGDYAIRLKFNDGTQILVDFKSFLSKSQHLSIKKYLKEDLFLQFRIINGNLNWNDYDLIFPVWDLYKGSIEA